MSIELKFRVWDFELKRMVYFQTLEAVTSVDGSIKLHAYGNLHSSGNISPLMQCSGIPDLSGNEIYKDDIILGNLIGSTNCYSGKVIFKHGAFRVIISQGSSEKLEKLLDDDFFGRVKIIGHIHANPELLNL